jgi:hypothetical protein
MSEQVITRPNPEAVVGGKVYKDLVRIHSFLGNPYIPNRHTKEERTHDEEGAPNTAKEEDPEIDLSKVKKKKKKKKNPAVNLNLEAQSKELVDAKGDKAASRDKTNFNKSEGIWAHDATKPIPYNLLLSRFVAQFREHHPSLSHFERERIRLPPPVCQREGSKKTVFVNISDICESYNHHKIPRIWGIPADNIRKVLVSSAAMSTSLNTSLLN